MKDKTPVQDFLTLQRVVDDMKVETAKPPTIDLSPLEIRLAALEKGSIRQSEYADALQRIEAVERNTAKCFGK